MTTDDRNYQLQGSYTRYCDGFHAGFDGEYGPSKRRNFKTIESAIKAAKKEFKTNGLPKVVRVDEGHYVDELGRRRRRLRCFAEDGHEFTHRDEYAFWHVDGMRVVDRVTQKVLWEA